MNENLLQEQELNVTAQEEVKFFDLPVSIKAEAALCVKELNSFRAEVEDKKNSILSRTNSIKEKVNELDVIYPGLKEKSKIEDIFDSTTKDYMNLIEVTLKEVDFFIQVCNRFVDSYQAKKDVNEDSINKFASEELKATKRYLKSRKKDLAVFFSRYDYGFKIHMNRLNMISKAAASAGAHSQSHSH